jgi:hypothetical protein
MMAGMSEPRWTYLAAAAPLHRNYPAGALISHLNDLEVSWGSGSLVLV